MQGMLRVTTVPLYQSEVIGQVCGSTTWATCTGRGGWVRRNLGRSAGVLPRSWEGRRMWGKNCLAGLRRSTVISLVLPLMSKVKCLSKRRRTWKEEKRTWKGPHTCGWLYGDQEGDKRHDCYAIS